MTIHITHRHIAAGEPQSCRFCPIALAISELYPGAYIKVTPGCIRAYDEQDMVWHANLPFEATKFIHNFDSYSPVKPFSFEIEIINN